MGDPSDRIIHQKFYHGNTKLNFSPLFVIDGLRLLFFTTAYQISKMTLMTETWTKLIESVPAVA
jgi:hypothetical protein